jgi:hypothetical protein
MAMMFTCHQFRHGYELRMIRIFLILFIIVESAQWLNAVEPAVEAGAAGATTKPQLQASSPTLYCAQDFTRRVLVNIHTPVSGISVRTTPDKRFAATVRRIDDAQVEIGLRALAIGFGTMELVGPDQVVLRRWQLQEVLLTTNSKESINHFGTLPDGSDIFGGELILKPYVTGLDVRFVCDSKTVTMMDGINERWIASATFTPTPSTGNAITSFRMVRPPKTKWVPFTYIMYQDGEQVSAGL